MDDLDVAGEYEPSTSQTSPTNHSGITLVLPSLRALKAANAGKKSKGKSANGLGNGEEQRPKIPRPIKLKPLKEVLTKLITQIKKKDDYAFFISPVDPAQVPGYADVIKNPMDFGTMTVKVNKGKYRSLEDFSNDFRLVTTNAKIFNPPGTIYHTEAERIETWGLEHIARASAHVIEYETDWNIDVEQDEDPSASQHVNIDDEVSTPRDIDGSLAAGSPAPSMTPAPGQGQGQAPGKRGPRGPYKKQAQSMLSEGLDAEGRMPGAKDGVGAFPPGSDWAELMIALKIKGKRYKTKKERLRFEKEGPPYHPDGSLNYFEMEDPFSFLNVFVPDPPTRPQVTPLFPPPTISATQMAMPTLTTINPSQLHPQPYGQSQSQPPQPPILPPTPITISPNRPIPVLSTMSNIPTQPAPTATTSASMSATASASTSTSTPTSTTTRPPKKRRHWTIVRNAAARSRLKDKDADASGVGGSGLGLGSEDAKAGWKVPRDVGPADYGTFATFLGELAGMTVGMGVTNRGVGVGASTGVGMGMGMGTGATTTTNAAAEYLYGSEHRLFATIRSTVEHRVMKRKRESEEGEGEDEENGDGDEEDGADADESALTLWTDEDAVDAWDYLRDVVYGGVDGYAYVRSLAEFVGPSVYLERGAEAEAEFDEVVGRRDRGRGEDDDELGDEDGDDEQDRKPVRSGSPHTSTSTSTSTRTRTRTHPLGVPLARYIEDNLVDPITRGRHGFLRDILLPLSFPLLSSPDEPHSYSHSHSHSHSHTHSHSNTRPPSLFDARLAFLKASAMNAHLLDMASLIRKPEELAKESVLEGWGPGLGAGAGVNSGLGLGVDGDLGADGNGDAEGQEDRDGEEHNEEEGHSERSMAWAQIPIGSEEEKVAIGRALEWSVGVIEELSRRVRVRNAHADVGADAEEEVKVKMEVVDDEPGEEQEEAEEEDAMDVDVDVDPSVNPKPDSEPKSKSEPRSDSDSDSASPSQEQVHKPNAGEDEDEDPLVKRLRMNLLALAKRAPVNRIAKLPIELVPESIRGVVPTA